MGFFKNKITFYVHIDINKVCLIFKFKYIDKNQPFNFSKSRF